jgi:hypothetical protein
MSESETPSLSPTNLLRLIVAALIFGVLVFAGIVVCMRLEMSPLEFGASPLDYVVLVLVPLQLVVSWIMPRQMLAASARALASRTTCQTDDAELLRQLQPSYIAAAIVGCALAEAACFVALVVLMMGGPNLLWILVGAALLMLVLRFPLGGSVERNLQAWGDFIREQQQFGMKS